MERLGQGIEINVRSRVYAATFSANDEHLLTGGVEGVQVWRLWRVEDGKQMAKLEAKNNVWCLAVSKDGRCGSGDTPGGGVCVERNLKLYPGLEDVQVANFNLAPRIPAVPRV